MRRSIVTRAYCLCVCLFVCLCLLAYLKPHSRTCELHKIFCTSRLWPWLGPSLAALRFATYFQFCGCRLPMVDTPYGCVTLPQQLRCNVYVLTRLLHGIGCVLLWTTAAGAKTGRVLRARGAEAEHAMHHCGRCRLSVARAFLQSVSVCLNSRSNRKFQTRLSPSTHTLRSSTTNSAVKFAAKWPTAYSLYRT